MTLPASSPTPASLGRGTLFAMALAWFWIADEVLPVAAAGLAGTGA